MTSADFRALLTGRADLAGLSIDPALMARLEAYFQLLATWNRKINLAGFDLTDPAPETLDRLLIEPLAAAKQAASGARVLDIGSGGGSPGIPFALAAHARSLTLVESKTRKSVFLKEALRTVGLTDSGVETARFEDLLSRPDLLGAFDIVTIRAVRVDSIVETQLAAFLQPAGQLFLFEGTTAEPVRIVSRGTL